MAQALNYPFPLPKSPAMKRVGIIIPDLSNPFFLPPFATVLKASCVPTGTSHI